MHNQIHTFNFPTPIRFGAGAIEELAPYLKDKGLSNPLIVTDAIVSELGFFKQIINNLQSKNFGTTVYSNLHKNPIESDVLGGVAVFHEQKCDSIIGIGGGVPMDVARAIALKAHHPRPLFDYEDSSGGWAYVTEEIPPFVTIPTTSGTGSEVGRSTVISDDVSHQKKILFSARLMAQQVFADPMLTMDMPAPVTAATGMDALTHNLEAFLSKGYHPMADGMALEAIRMIAQNLETATHKPDLKSRTEMMAASLIGATAFQKGLGVVHSLAHPLSTMFDTHHGLANAIMLSYGMRFNIAGQEERFTRIAHAIGLGQQHGEAVVQYLVELNGKLHIPLKLSAIEVKESHIDPLSDLALADACHPCNPKPVTLGDFKQLYRAAL